MMIDPALEQAFEHDPKQTVDVILIAHTPTEALVPEMERCGFEVTSREHEKYGIFYGRISLDHLPELRQIKEIQSIALDAEQHAF
ncbi:MAG: hypothetical protein ACE5G0_10165 [Rhodothermales bacterium]